MNFFNLEFNYQKDKSPFFSSFPFIFNGSRVGEVLCGISSCSAGSQRNKQNRHLVFNELNLKEEQVFSISQVHSRIVLAADTKTRPLGCGDGLVTNDSNIILSVLVADCLPVYLYDTESGAFGIVHSGWKGTGIVAEAINLMKEKFVTNPCDIAAVLGPCIGCCCYKVDAERADFFKKEFGIESVRKSNEDFFLDLKAANIKLLKDIGVNNIAVCNNCTFCDERLGSFRREGAQFTHMVAMIYTEGNLNLLFHSMVWSLM